jgi:uncharacterized membrane protein required for colicin V production
MGLDLALGIVILVLAFRGWFHGFITQAVRIAGLIACVYAADPVRDFGKPRVLPYLPAIQPDLVDRLLWWVSAAAAYVILVGVTSLLIKMTRRPEIPGIPRSNRNDQFAGFFLGACKGFLVATLVVAGIEKYGLNEIKSVSWAEEQAKASWALRWNAQYQPAARMWSSRPVRHFVNHIHRMGLQNPGEPSQSLEAKEPEEKPPLQTASRTGDIEMPDRTEAGSDPGASANSPASSSAAESPALGPELEKDIEQMKSELNARGKGLN